MNEFEQNIREIKDLIDEIEIISLEKIKEKEGSATLSELDNANKSELQSTINQQQKIIENLSRELNNAQKTIKEIGRENDFLKDKNRFFADKIFKMKSQGSKLVQKIEEEIELVRKIIKEKL